MLYKDAAFVCLFIVYWLNISHFHNCLCQDSNGNVRALVLTMSAMYRPLPPPPRPTGARPPPTPRPPDVLSYPYSGHSNVTVPEPQDELPTMTFPSGTLLHKGFYDLLAMIPTPLPSRILWNASPPEQPVLVGPRYEHIAPTGTRPTVRKGRRVSKDMVSKPTGFV